VEDFVNADFVKVQPLKDRPFADLVDRKKQNRKESGAYHISA
jgi:hypothetical protein